MYVETPKVCCSTIKVNLQRLETRNFQFHWDDDRDIHNRALSPLIKPSQTLEFDRLIAKKELFTFCFVRNPYTRLLSCYLDKIAGNKPPKRQVLEIMGRSGDELDMQVTFSEFVEVISSQKIFDMNPHWRPQYYQTFQDTIAYDYVGRYESFANDFGQVLSRISSGSIKRFAIENRHGTNADNKIPGFYTGDILRKVNTLFAIDFEHFNYRPMDKIQ